MATATLAAISVPKLSASRDRAQNAWAALHTRNLAMWVATANDGVTSVSGLTDCLDSILVAQGAPATLPEHVSACITAPADGHLVVTVQSANARTFTSMY